MALPGIPSGWILHAWWDRRRHHAYHGGAVPPRVVVRSGHSHYLPGRHVRRRPRPPHLVMQRAMHKGLLLPGRLEQGRGGAVWRPKPLLSHGERDPDRRAARLVHGQRIDNDAQRDRRGAARPLRHARPPLRVPRRPVRRLDRPDAARLLGRCACRLLHAAGLRLAPAARVRRARAHLPVELGLPAQGHGGLLHHDHGHRPVPARHVPRRDRGGRPVAPHRDQLPECRRHPHHHLGRAHRGAPRRARGRGRERRVGGGAARAVRAVSRGQVQGA
mmetsp:Transcript_26010/g.69227  ORF Transcript_26010/g.69227 Transcript_26010/m.69227 type:complete len:274 (+) Transcript_26010:788-1609(+)